MKLFMNSILLALVAANNNNDGFVSRMLNGYGHDECPYYCIYRAKALRYCIHDHDSCKDKLKDYFKDFDFCDAKNDDNYHKNDDKKDYKDHKDYKDGYKDGYGDGYDAKKCDKYHAYDAASNNTVDLGSLTDPMSDVGDFSSTDDGHV